MVSFSSLIDVFKSSLVIGGLDISENLKCSLAVSNSELVLGRFIPFF
jgi:hypothetical protein